MPNKNFSMLGDFRWRGGLCQRVLYRFLIWMLGISMSFAATASADAEKGMLAPHAVIRSAAEIDYPPFSFVDREGRPNGFSVALLRAALSAMGREVIFRTGTWNEVRGWLEREEIETLPLVGRTPEREAIFDFTFPYMSLHGAIVVRGEQRGIGSLEDLRGRTVAVMQGDNAEEFLRREDLGIHIVTTPTFQAALQDLSEGRCDAVVIQRLVALRLIQERGLENLRVLGKPVEGFRQDFCFAVREGDRETLALLNEGLALVIADGTYGQLHAEWFAALELPTHRRIVIGGDHNYPPYEYLDENGRPSGYNVDLTMAIAREVGLDVEIRLGPWGQIRDALARGEIDALQGMFYSPERDLTFDFTAAHTVNHCVSVVRSGERPPPAAVAELAGLRIVVQQGDIMHDFALKNDLADHLTVVDAQEDALRELAMGKHDCALVSRLTARYWIEKHGWRNLTVGRQPLLSPAYCFAVPHGRKALLAQLGEGLKVLDATGEYRRIYEKWMGVYDDTAPGLRVLLRYGAWAGAISLLLVMGAALWFWSLRKQVARKTRELSESESRFRLFAELTPVGIVISDEQEKTLYISSKFTELFGYTMVDMPSVKEWWDLAYPDEALRNFVRTRWKAAVAEARRSHSEIHPMEFPVRCKDGSVREIEFRMATTGKLNVVVLTDITERKKVIQERETLQEQLNQAQKMESVGRLAGGVAHDFNNLLSIIMGYGELLLDEVQPGDPHYEPLQEIQDAAVRARDVTRQLLAFSRKQLLEVKNVDLNGVVTEVERLLRRVLGEDIELRLNLSHGPLIVAADSAQLAQVLMNLAVNARDAMAEGGTLTIETRRTVLDQAYTGMRSGTTPGDYAMIQVSDTGSGMDKETLAHIFEPFFTTKSKEKGTGLGLATSYGIIKQHGGNIWGYSEPGQGAVFKIYLPLSASTSPDEPQPVVSRQTAPSLGTVMVVEDDPAVRAMVVSVVRRGGHQVIETVSVEDAVEKAASHAGPLHLVLTDVVMPGMMGPEVFSRIAAHHPEARVLYMSGYSDNVIAHRGVLEPDIDFIEKPFTVDRLLAKVDQVLKR